MLPLRHPFTAIVAGLTSCSKTRFVFRLINHVSRMIDPPPSRIVHCYGEYQQLFYQYPRVVFHHGLPDLNDFDGREPVLLNIDYLMQETDETVANLFTKGSHHRKWTSCTWRRISFRRTYMPQRLTASLNTHYMILFKNPWDATQFDSLARYMYPKSSQFAVEAYKDATREPYSYLLVYVNERTYFLERRITFILPNKQTRQKLSAHAETQS